MLCVYLYVSLLMCFKFDGVWTKVICYQGIFVSLGQRERGDIKAICVMNEIGILIVIITLIYILMVFRCRRKDYVQCEFYNKNAYNQKDQSLVV